MIAPGYVRAMAAYNAEMNRRLYAAADRLGDDAPTCRERRLLGQQHGPLNHILWGDRNWMSRFAGWMPSSLGMKDSPRLHEDFSESRHARVQADADLLAWAEAIDPDWLPGMTPTCYSGALQREVSQLGAGCW